MTTTNGQTMSDPAILAAQRHAETLAYGFESRLDRFDLFAAAREALAPIRSWYENLPESAHVPELDGLLPLIYSDEEVNDA